MAVSCTQDLLTISTIFLAYKAALKSGKHSEISIEHDCYKKEVEKDYEWCRTVKAVKSAISGQQKFKV